MHNLSKRKNKSSSARPVLLLAALLVFVAVTILCISCIMDDENNVIIDVNLPSASPMPGDTLLPGDTSPTEGLTGPAESSTPGEQTAPIMTAIPVPTEVPATAPVLNTDAPTPVPTPVPSATELPKNTPSPAPDYSIFENCAFVGNSTFEGLHRFGIITQGSFFTKVGLNILSVYEQTTSQGSVPIIDELNTGSYEGVILMFGENELGWPDLNVFINKYSQLLDDVWARQPGCKIFIMGIPPVSEAKSAQGAESGVNNERIQMYNAQLQDLASRRNCFFVTVPDKLMTSSGALPDEASSDGLHLNMEYSRYWADHICLSVTAGLR